METDADVIVLLEHEELVRRDFSRPPDHRRITISGDKCSGIVITPKGRDYYETAKAGGE